MSLDGVHHDVKREGGGGGIYETRPCREIRDQSVAYDKKKSNETRERERRKDTRWTDSGKNTTVS